VSKRLSVIFGEFKTVVIGYFTIVDYISSNVIIGSTNSIIMKAFLIRLVKTSFNSAHIDYKYFFDK
ncbi:MULTISPECIES: hypothetical protein, partial [unclassified Bacillus cereus group]|uniref:hypothetical protein n=1 Tax=unclassified Bacillus cereus group TaxID=2750818 RepID=UPI0022DFCA03